MSVSNPWGIEISYSQLRAYLDCPWLYRLRYVEDKRSAPTPPSSLGVSIHGALETFHAAKGKGLDALLDAYEERWLHEGYASPQEQMEWHRKGEMILRAYWESESKSASRIVCVEREFVFPLENHKVRGRMDRVDQRPDGTYEIVDYKSHDNFATEEEAARDLQLRIYALGAREGLGLEPSWLSFYYVGAGRRVSAAYDPSGEEELRALLTRAADELSAEKSFEPDTSHCPRCAFVERCARAKK